VLLLAPWLLVSNLFVTIGTIFGERFLYLPSAGFALVLGGAAASALAASRAPRGWVGAIVLLLLLAAARTSAYAPAWHDDFRLFSAAERAAPRSVRVLSNLGTELALRGELTEAEARLVRAREIAPWVLPVRINLAGVYLNLGRLDEAEAEARAALRIAPDDPVARAQWEVIRSKR